jgi:hypothetical protein
MGSSKCGKQRSCTANSAAAHKCEFRHNLPSETERGHSFLTDCRRHFPGPEPDYTPVKVQVSNDTFSDAPTYLW